MKTNFDEVIKQKDIVVLDGAMSTELENIGINLNDSLWTAKVLAEEPEAIKQVYSNYITSGADACMTASYQASILGYTQRGYSIEEAESFIANSIYLLLEARKEWWESEGKKSGRIIPLAIASIGPYGAYLADGSEYTGNYDVTEANLRNFHKRRIEILKEAGAEIFGLDTFPNLTEAKICAEIFEELKVDFYASFSFKNEKVTNSGNTILECVEGLNKYKKLKAIGVNCTKPKYITDIIKGYKKVTDLPIIVYPNSGEEYDPITKKWNGEKDLTIYTNWLNDWAEAGATIIGGCCGVTHEDINQIYKFFKSQNC